VRSEVLGEGERRREWDLVRDCGADSERVRELELDRDLERRREREREGDGDREGR